MQLKNSKIYKQKYANGYAIAIDTFDEREFEQIKNLFENFSDTKRSLVPGCYRGYYYFKSEDLVRCLTLYFRCQLFLEGKFKYEQYSRRKRNACIRKEKVVDNLRLVNKYDIQEKAKNLANNFVESIEKKDLFI